MDDVATEPVDAQRPRARLGAPWRVLRKLGPTSVALLALGSSGIALAFTLWPSLAPDPRTTYRADIGVFAVERNVTFGDYLRRIAFSPERYRERRAEVLHAAGMRPADAAGMMRLPGQLAYVESTVEGFKRRRVDLRWSLYDARSQRRVPGPSFGDVPAVRLDLDAPTDRTVQLVWIPPPPGHGPYFLRVSLHDEHDTLLDVADSKPFRTPW